MLFVRTLSKMRRSNVLILILVFKSSINGQMASIICSRDTQIVYILEGLSDVSAYSVIFDKMFKIYSLILLFGGGVFFNWPRTYNSQILLPVRLNSLRISFDIFCLSAIFPSVIFYTNWGTIGLWFIFSNKRIYSINFNAMRATLKFGSPNNFIRIGRKFLAIV